MSYVHSFAMVSPWILVSERSVKFSSAVDGHAWYIEETAYDERAYVQTQ